MLKEKSLFKGETAKQIEAKELIEVKGLTQKDAANKLGVSEKIIGIWIMKFKWNKPDVLAEKKKSAEQLLAQHFSQKEVGVMVGISERSIGLWVKKYKWSTNKAKKQSLSIHHQKVAISNFLLYVECHKPKLSKQLHELSVSYYNEELGLLAP